MISRGAFYQNFEDKFQLLKICIKDIKEELEIFDTENSDKQYINNLIEFMLNNKILIKHLIIDSNTELMYLFVELVENDIITSITQKKGLENLTELEKAEATFIAGGLTNILIKQLRDNFPISKEVMFELLSKAQYAVMNITYDS